MSRSRLRSTPLKRSTKPLRRTRIKPVSDDMKAKRAKYGLARLDYLSRRMWCEIRIECNGDRATDIHHRWPRSRSKDALLDTATWVASCRMCHSWVHSHPRRARELGLLMNRKEQHE